MFDRIIIIDDDYVSGYLSRITTEEMNIAEEVIHLQSADKGIAFIKNHCLENQVDKAECPDLILLDIHMPVKDGYEFLDELQRMGQEAIIHLKVIVLTSSGTLRDKEKMKQYGIKGIIEKPISEIELLELIAKAD